MKNVLLFLAFGLVIIGCSTEEQKFETKIGTDGKYQYEYVVGDAMNTRIYTLENGLKVYLSDFENEPRTQVYIPVKAGGKNDPASNTGLAHYLEHMMFKGNDQFGTIDYEKEKVLLDSIEWMFNEYAKITDPEERKIHYSKIDEMSGRAANFAIPNEYDKMIAELGGKYLNAYTTDDRTVYTVDIPSNEIEKFLEVEGTRFRKIVNRLFHTELEAVYEEKNRSLDSDGSKVFEAIGRELFKNHQYGTQTVIGTIEHLKNPSITEIVNYFNTYYRPNNVAICISGDIDFSATIAAVDKFFGDWESNPDLPVWNVAQEDPITSPRAVEILGPDAEFVTMAYRFGGYGSDDYLKLQVMDLVLSNSEAGLIDLDLLQQQKVLRAFSSAVASNDYSMHLFRGYPKEGQTMEEVQELLLAEIEKVKKGEFDDWLIPAVVADMKQSEMRQMERNASRANGMVMAFTNGIEWSDYVSRMDRIEKITKEDIVKFANENYSDNYAIVFKRTGEDPNKQRVEKPQITKVPLNRDVRSEFHVALAEKESAKLQPKFVNYEEEIQKSEMKSGIQVIGTKNKNNGLFNLYYVLDMGQNNDPSLPIAVQYLEFLGTSERSAEDFKKEFYKIGCSFSVSAGDEEIYISVGGLDENIDKAMVLMEDLMANAESDQKQLDQLVQRSLKAREDSKRNKGAILYGGLMAYGQYGAKSPFTNVLSNQEMMDLSGDELLAKVKKLPNMEHRVMYYGPRSVDEIIPLLNQYHQVAEELQPVPEKVVYEEKSTDEPMVYWTNYDMVQTEFMVMHKGQLFDAKRVPEARIYNEYFGGGMNSIVFQEIREAQGLAYSTFSSYATGSEPSKSDLVYAYVGTQADKQGEAMAAIRELLENMPKSQEAFDVAKQSILSKLESERIIGSSILWNYESAKKQGLNYDIRKDIYTEVQNMTLDNVMAFHDKYIKGQGFITVLIGNREMINFEDLKKYGEVKELSIDELFGFENTNPVNVEVQK